MIRKKTYIRQIIAGVLPLLGIVFTGCINEQFNPCSPDMKIISAGSDAYVAIKLPNTSATRASDIYEDGEHDSEHDISPAANFALFFKLDGTLISKAPLLKSELEHSEFDDPENKDHDNKEAIYKAKFSVPDDITVPDGQPQPYGYCLVVLNASNKLNNIQENASTLNQVLQIFWEEKENPENIGRHGEYFTMTNSAYIVNGAVQVATPFTTDVIQEGSEFDWNKAITVYVERMVAKVSVDFDEDKFAKADDASNGNLLITPDDNRISVFKGFDEEGSPVYESNIFEYKVKITGWGINALEKNNYLFKHINALDYFANWSAPNDWRTYWSEDKNYNKTNYPVQYRDAVDKQTVKFFEAYSENTDNLLKNYSYNEFIEQNNFNKINYIPENTYDFKSATLKSNLGSRMDVLAGSHLIVTAQLLTNLNDDFEANDVYRDRIGNFYRTEEECFKVLVSRFNYALNTQERMRFRSYDWGLGGVFDKGDANGELSAETHGEYKLYYGDEPLDRHTLKDIEFEENNFSEPATIINGDGKRIFWLDNLTIKKEIRNDDGTITLEPLKIATKFGHDPYGNETIEESREATDNEIKSLFFEWVGAVDHFKDGKMYYYEPIRHNVNGSNITYGVVRNHWYKFGIVNVNAIGTSVDNDGEPIVPDKEKTYNQLTFKIDILLWHESEQQAPII